MAQSALVVAKEILKLAQAENRGLTPLQLIKMVYISHGWCLAHYKRPLINENIEAWTYGPVIPELYQKVKSYGSDPVLNIDTPDIQISGDDKQLIKAVYDSLKEKSGLYLSSLTHQPGTPWEKTWENGQGKNVVISNDLIQDFYQSKLNRN